MTHSFLNDLSALTIVLFLFFSMLIAILIGYKMGLKKTKSETKNTEIS